jgi:ribose transport system permease protein
MEEECLMLRLWNNRTARPYLLLVLTVALFSSIGGDKVLTLSTAYSVLQHFATLGPVALGLGLTILARNFDLSVAGVVGLAGCVAVLLGGSHPLLGLIAAVAVGAAFGLVQGAIIVRLNLSSIGVTLGGLLTATGLAYVATGNQEVRLARPDIPALMDGALVGPMSLRFLVALAMFAVAAIVVSRTRAGRDLLAAGSDPKAALVAGVPVGAVVIAAFMLAGICSALGGALLSFSLAAASPLPLSNTLVPAAAAAIIGGVSLRGGRGDPMGIAGGVLVLSALQTGLTALGVDPFAQDIATGGVLLTVGVLDGADLPRRINDFNRRFGRGAFGPAKRVQG